MRYLDASLQIAKADKKEPIEYSHDDTEQLYLEGAAFGQLYSVLGSDSGIEVKIYSPPPPEPLTEEQAKELAKRTVKNQGLPFGNMTSSEVGHGTFRIGFMNHEQRSQDEPSVVTLICTVAVGLYTHKVISFKTPAGSIT